ncbi:hypothetical protein LTR10_024278 [Elasticomyces elasticus]|nr:hypothetical protein LTR10_024278 [Elasticomyces elasticus]KAK5176011.1 hypothetical protein LTR44_011426 [Eurotiomycetes sp. CCFEE 6388]
MSNASQKSSFLHTGPWGSVGSTSSTIHLPNSYRDALAAKQRALSLLKSALGSLAPADLDVALAVVLLFIDFELIDSGRDHWKHHIEGAKTIIETLAGSDTWTQTAMSPLRTSLISNCLVFDIIGSALSSPVDHGPRNLFPAGNLSLLQDAEGNHCSSFPACLLQLLLSGSKLSWPNHPSSPPHPSVHAKQQQDGLSLLSTAQNFNPLAWAMNVQPHSPATDLQHRTHIASAHQAGVCIYLSRVLLSLDSTAPIPNDLELLVRDVIIQLSLIPKSHALFKSTTWPAFIAGAETNVRDRQEWVVKRFEELWEVEPWGLIPGALGELKKMWSSRMTVTGKFVIQDGKQHHGSWIEDLRGRGVDWLII